MSCNTFLIDPNAPMDGWNVETLLSAGSRADPIISKALQLSCHEHSLSPHGRHRRVCRLYGREKAFRWFRNSRNITFLSSTQGLFDNNPPLISVENILKKCWLVGDNTGSWWGGERQAFFYLQLDVVCSFSLGRKKNNSSLVKAINERKTIR